MKVMKESIQN